MLSLPHGRLLLTIGWILIGAIVIGSLGPALPIRGVQYGDKLEHFSAYFGLTLWFAGLYPRRRLWAIALAFFLMGAMLEVAQGTLTTSRQMDIFDLMTNSIGIAAGVFVALLGLSEWGLRLESFLLRRRADRESA
jgi:VanZ family protein